MLFDDYDLREVIARTEGMIELRDNCGRFCRLLSRDEALRLDLALFIGVGNRRRIRFLRCRTRKFRLNAGSRTTERLKDGSGINISHPLIQEHRPVPSDDIP